MNQTIEEVINPRNGNYTFGLPEGMMPAFLELVCR